MKPFSREKVAEKRSAVAVPRARRVRGDAIRHTKNRARAHGVIFLRAYSSRARVVRAPVRRATRHREARPPGHDAHDATARGARRVVERRRRRIEQLLGERFGRESDASDASDEARRKERTR